MWCEWMLLEPERVNGCLPLQGVAAHLSPSFRLGDPKVDPPGPSCHHLVTLIHVVADRSREIDRSRARARYLLVPISCHKVPSVCQSSSRHGGSATVPAYIIGLTKLCQNLRLFKAPSSVFCRDKNPTNPTTLQILNHIDLRGDLNAPYNKQRQQKSTHNQHHIAS